MVIASTRIMVLFALLASILAADIALAQDDLFDQHYRLAEAAMARQNWQSAIDSFEQALALEPDHVNSLNHIGFCHARLGQWQQAIDRFEHALSLAGQSSDVTVIEKNLASACLKLGHEFFEASQFEKAREFYEKTLRIKPEAVAPAYNLGLTYVELNQPEKAVRWFERVVETSSEKQMVAGAYYWLGAIGEDRGKSREAFEAFKKSWQLFPTNNAIKGMRRLRAQHHTNTQSHADADVATYQRAQESLVLVRVHKADDRVEYAQGFMFGDSEVVTVSHVCGGEVRAIEVELQDGSKIAVDDVAWSNLDNDIVSFNVPIPREKFKPLSPEDSEGEGPVVGDELILIALPGFMQKNGLGFFVSKVLQVDDQAGYLHYLIDETPTISGTSGTPMVNRRGELAGMHSGHQDDPQHMSLDSLDNARSRVVPIVKVQKQPWPEPNDLGRWLGEWRPDILKQLYEARLLTTRRRASQAIGRLEAMKASDQYPNLSGVWLALGTNYAATGRWDEALFAFNRVLELEPEDLEGSFEARFEASWSIARLYFSQNKRQKSMELAQELLDKNLQNTRAHRYFIDLCIITGNYQAAAKAAIAAAKTFPDDPEFPALLGKVRFRERNREESAQAFSQAAAVCGEDTGEGLYFTAIAHLVRGNRKMSQQIAEELRSRDVVLFFQLGSFRSRL